jgi:hypothetical protein
VPGLLSRLFTRSTAPSPPPATTVKATLYSGDETLEVVGESHYQDALWAIAGGRQLERVRYETYALLVPDPENPHDANAIEILIAGQLVGFLSRHDAVRYRPGLLKLMSESPTPLIALHAVVVGGGQRADGLGYLGVFLDHDPDDFGLPRHHVSHGQLRTGVHEALETDLADGTHPLSWFGRLAEDDIAAVDELSVLLKDTSDPFERHYLFCELEHRLYRCRTKIASALDQFDVVCEQHHGEMGSIRPALLERFGAIPVIELYRQAAIRWAKTKHWRAVQEWADRGISVYGDQAARPEVVDDLHKRVAHAIAKVEEADQPKRRQPTGTTLSTSAGAAVFETLVCEGCGRPFQRKRSRGRKPLLCPACRASSVPAVDI